MAPIIKPSFNIDLHVHTNHGSACAELNNPVEIPDMMHRRNLHGIVLTEHDMMWSATELDELNRTLSGKKIFRGVEVTTSVFHFVVIGLTDMKGIFEGIDPRALGEIVSRQRAAMILAHPHMMKRDSVIHDIYDEIPEQTHAIEVYSTSTENQNSENAKKIARNLNIHQVAGSDAHYIEKLGAAYTEFPSMPESEFDLADMIIHGDGKPKKE